MIGKIKSFSRMNGYGVEFDIVESPKGLRAINVTTK